MFYDIFKLTVVVLNIILFINYGVILFLLTVFSSCGGLNKKKIYIYVTYSNLLKPKVFYHF